MGDLALLQRCPPEQVTLEVDFKERARREFQEEGMSGKGEEQDENAMWSEAKRRNRGLVGEGRCWKSAEVFTLGINHFSSFHAGSEAGGGGQRKTHLVGGWAGPG